MASVTVRQARGVDDIDLVSVKRAAIEDGAGDDYTADQVAAWTPDLADLDDYGAAVASDKYLVLVAERDGDVVGFGIVGLESGSLLALYVQPAERGTGVGSTLLGHAEASARLNGAGTLDLLASKNAVDFYAGHGYERADCVERAVDGERLTFVAMERDLAVVRRTE